MKVFKKLIICGILFMIYVPISYAQLTVLPKGAEGVDCNKVINDFEVMTLQEAQNAIRKMEDKCMEIDATQPGGSETVQKCWDNIYSSGQFQQYSARIQENGEVLACAIKTGRVSLTMVPYFVKYIADFALGLIGLVSILFIVIGGYYYIYGGLTDNKEKGKKTIFNALVGMGIAILSWAIVSAVIAAVTG